jgi:citrate lyase subunit beta/citryl-CoA lyase
MTDRLRRSALYLPGSNVRALEKARTLAADVLIFDLEDAVSPAAKKTAREQVRAAVQAGGFDGREIVVRVNGLATEWGVDDLNAAIVAQPDAVLIPKISGCEDILATATVIRAARRSPCLPIWAMIETPLAILNIASIAAMNHDPALRPAVFVIGVNDLVKETRVRLASGRDAIIPWLMQCVAAARAYRIGVLDGVWNDLSDAAGLRQECIQSRDLGMDGKTLIHPNQLAVCNEIFAPTAADLEWAHKVITAFALPQNAAKGAIQLEGRMVERLHADMARHLIATAEALPR